MNSPKLILILLLITTNIFAQQRKVEVIEAHQLRSSFAPIEIEVPQIYKTTSLSTLAFESAESVDLLIKIGDQPLRKLNRFSHQKKTDKKWISELIYLAENEKVSIVSNYVNQKSISLHFYQESLSTIQENATFPIINNSSQACPCPQPEYLDRQGWCPAGNCPEHPNPEMTVVTHLIVHHAASTNTSSDWSGVVRSIWDFHVNTNGWSDIGYNWLIDPNGVVYEGRGNDYLGAHFCGKNTGTQGFCMLGNYQSIEPSLESIHTLTKILAWKACDRNLDPLASTFHESSGLLLDVISGHRQGCSTECPGDAFFPLFPEIRLAVDAAIDDCDVFLPPTWVEGNVLSDAIVSLKWSDNTSNENSFLLDRSVDDALHFEFYKSLEKDATIFNDSFLINNTSYFYKIRAVTASDTTDFSSILELKTFVTSIYDTGFPNEIVIYPNPVGEELFIELPQEYLEYELKIFSTDGHLLAKRKLFSTKEKVDLSTVDNGLFLLNITNGQQVFWKKIIVQK